MLSIGKWWRRSVRFLRIRFLGGVPAMPGGESTCLNCGTVYAGNFCPRCGQNRRVERITMSKMLRNVLNGFTNIDRGFFYTLVAVVVSPGRLVRSYLAGRRVSYFHPFQMLFILGAIFGMLSTLFGTPADPNANFSIDTDTIAIPEGFVRLVRSFATWFDTNVALRTILTIPVYALATRWAFRRVEAMREVNFAELLYLRAFTSCQLLAFSLLYLPLSGFDDAGVPFYVELLLTLRIYWGFAGGRWQRLVWPMMLMYVFWLLIVALIWTVAFVGVGEYYGLFDLLANVVREQQ